MKQLPCWPFKGNRHCEDELAKLAHGEPYYLSTFPDTFRGDDYTYRCEGCGGTCKISFDEFVRLPEVTEAQLIDRGLVTWEQHKLPDGQALQLLEAGFTARDVKELSR